MVGRGVGGGGGGGGEGGLVYLEFWCKPCMVWVS